MDSTRCPKDDDTEAKIALLLEFKELAGRMRREYPSLTKQHPEHWAALVPSGEMFIAATMHELFAILDEKGLRYGPNVVVEYLDPNPRSTI